MKTAVRTTFFLFFLSLFFLSLTPYPLKKKITDTEFRYEFYTVVKTPKAKPGRYYYWFKAGAIHTTQSGAAGEVLDGGFEKFFLSNQLAEKGSFTSGLKTGMWQSWHSNGTLATVTQWEKGLQSGKYYEYNEMGTMIKTGQYRFGKKHGRWIHFITGDTLYFKKDVRLPKKKTKEEEKQVRHHKNMKQQQQQLDAKKIRLENKIKRFEDKIEREDEKKEVAEEKKKTASEKEFSKKPKAKL